MLYELTQEERPDRDYGDGASMGDGEGEGYGCGYDHGMTSGEGTGNSVDMFFGDGYTGNGRGSGASDAYNLAIAGVLLRIAASSLVKAV